MVMMIVVVTSCMCVCVWEMHNVFVTCSRHLEKFKDKPQELDVNCKDPLGRSSVAVAIENENLDLLECLLEYKIKPKVRL